jgi:hypothetical protein
MENRSIASTEDIELVERLLAQDPTDEDYA